jgi:gas vesicle protein
MNKERLTQLAEKLLSIPDMIYSHQTSILDLNEKSQSISDEISQIESTIKSSISAAMDENGKKVYSNAESRESAFIDQASSHDVLNEKKADLALVQRAINSDRIKIEALGNEQRNIRSLLGFFAGSDSEKSI